MSWNTRMVELGHFALVLAFALSLVQSACRSMAREPAMSG